MKTIKVLHIIDAWNIGGIQEMIFNLYKYSNHIHSGRGYHGSLSDEMGQRGFKLNEGTLKDYDVLVGHTVGGWSYDDTFAEAKNAGLKTVEVMHSPAHSPTNPSVTDAFVGLNQVAVDLNSQFSNRRKIYAMANNVSPVMSDRPYDVGRVSRVVPEKCPDVFADIALHMRNKRFVLGGDGSMLDYIKSLGIPNLEFTGMVRDFSTFLSKIRVFAFPTRDECCSMSVAMAQSAMLPCVVQDIPALRETTGGYAEFATSTTDFAFKVINLLDCPVDAKKLAIEAYEWSLKNFTPAVVCGYWDGLLEELQ